MQILAEILNALVMLVLIYKDKYVTAGYNRFPYVYFTYASSNIIQIGSNSDICWNYRMEVCLRYVPLIFR